MSKLGEIDRDFYCSADRFEHGGCMVNLFGECKENCSTRRRKHPTPEQFKEEYGFEYPDDWAVYVDWTFYGSGKPERFWKVFSHWKYKEMLAEENSWKEIHGVVCACTPWGKPDNDWGP